MTLALTAPLERYRKLVVQREAALLALTSAETTLEQVQHAAATAEQVRVFFTFLAEEQRKQLEARVQALVDYGVQAVFGSNCRFVVRSELRGKSVRTEFYFVEDGLELPLLEATGGGVGDVVAFLLRIVMLCLSKPVQRRVIVLDEPFKFLSAAHFEKLGTLLTELTVGLGLQIIMVTHRLELVDAATTVVKVTKKDGVSVADVEQHAV